MKPENRQTVLRILTESFKDNKSIMFMVGNDNKSLKRLHYLLNYSINKAELFGHIILNEDQTACAILIDKSKEKFSIKSTILDIGLIINVIGLSRLTDVLKREKLLKNLHPNTPFLHLWYIGVNPKEQSKGVGSKFIQTIAKQFHNKPIVLETSNSKNIPFYEKNGFSYFNELHLDDYKMTMFKR